MATSKSLSNLLRPVARNKPSTLESESIVSVLSSPAPLQKPDRGELRDLLSRPSVEVRQKPLVQDEPARAEDAFVRYVSGGIQARLKLRANIERIVSKPITDVVADVVYMVLFLFTADTETPPTVPHTTLREALLLLLGTMPKNGAISENTLAILMYTNHFGLSANTCDFLRRTLAIADMDTRMEAFFASVHVRLEALPRFRQGKALLDAEYLHLRMFGISLGHARIAHATLHHLEKRYSRPKAIQIMGAMRHTSDLWTRCARSLAFFGDLPWDGLMLALLLRSLPAPESFPVVMDSGKALLVSQHYGANLPLDSAAALFYVTPEEPPVRRRVAANDEPLGQVTLDGDLVSSFVQETFWPALQRLVQERVDQTTTEVLEDPRIQYVNETLSAGREIIDRVVDGVNQSRALWESGTNTVDNFVQNVTQPTIEIAEGFNEGVSRVFRGTITSTVTGDANRPWVDLGSRVAIVTFMQVVKEGVGMLCRKIGVWWDDILAQQIAHFFDYATETIADTTRIVQTLWTFADIFDRLFIPEAVQSLPLVSELIAYVSQYSPHIKVVLSHFQGAGVGVFFVLLSVAYFKFRNPFRNDNISTYKLKDTPLREDQWGIIEAYYTEKGRSASYAKKNANRDNEDSTATDESIAFFNQDEYDLVNQMVLYLESKAHSTVANSYLSVLKGTVFYGSERFDRTWIDLFLRGKAEPVHTFIVCAKKLFTTKDPISGKYDTGAIGDLEARLRTFIDERWSTTVASMGLSSSGVVYGSLLNASYNKLGQFYSDYSAQDRQIFTMEGVHQDSGTILVWETATREIVRTINTSNIDALVLVVFWTAPPQTVKGLDAIQEKEKVETIDLHGAPSIDERWMGMFPNAHTLKLRFYNHQNANKITAAFLGSRDYTVTPHITIEVYSDCVDSLIGTTSMEQHGLKILNGYKPTEAPTYSVAVKLNLPPSFETRDQLDRRYFRMFGVEQESITRRYIMAIQNSTRKHLDGGKFEDELDSAFALEPEDVANVFVSLSPNTTQITEFVLEIDNGALVVLQPKTYLLMPGETKMVSMPTLVVDNAFKKETLTRIWISPIAHPVEFIDVGLFTALKKEGFAASKVPYLPKGKDNMKNNNGRVQNAIDPTYLDKTVSSHLSYNTIAFLGGLGLTVATLAINNFSGAWGVAGFQALAAYKAYKCVRSQMPKSIKTRKDEAGDKFKASWYNVTREGLSVYRDQKHRDERITGRALVHRKRDVRRVPVPRNAGITQTRLQTGLRHYLTKPITRLAAKVSGRGKLNRLREMTERINDRKKMDGEYLKPYDPMSSDSEADVFRSDEEPEKEPEEEQSSSRTPRSSRRAQQTTAGVSKRTLTMTPRRGTRNRPPETQRELYRTVFF